MTIERPMFPPFADEHCQMISFVDCQKAGRRISVRGGNPFLEGPAETYAIEIEHTPPRAASASHGHTKRQSALSSTAGSWDGR